MKQRVLIPVIFLLLVFCVCALEVELISPPAEAYVFESNTINFRCKAIGNDILQLYLYTDISGTWNKTDSFSNPPSDTEITFTVSNIDNGNYIWNCRAVSIDGNKFYDTDWPFIVDFQNDPPIFAGPIPNQTWSQDASQNNALDLDIYFTDTDSITYSVSGNSNIFVSIASDGQVSFSQPTGWWGTEEVTFRATDTGGYTDSNKVTLTVTQGTSTCTEDWDCTSWSDCTNDEQTRTCEDTNHCNTTNNKPSESRSCGSTCTEDWYCDSWSECEDGYKTRDCTDENSCGTTEDKPSETKSCSVTSNDEFTIEITKAIPSYNNIKIKPGDEQEFEITTNEDGDIAWYIDNIRKQTGSEIFTYKPTSTEAGSHIIKVIISSEFNENDKDSKTWDIKVEDETIPTESLCGNDKADVNETCLNCPQDIPCQEGEYCDEGICKTKNLNLITGFATKTKNFVVQSWYYPTLILSIIVLLIIILKITKLKKKPKKDEYLAEFSEKKTLLKRFRKKLREWDRKKQLKKQNKETLKRIKTEKENNIRLIAPGIESIIAFVNQKVSEGTPKRQIKRVLKRKGWSRKQIRKAFKKIKNDSRKPT